MSSKSRKLLRKSVPNTNSTESTTKRRSGARSSSRSTRDGSNATSKRLPIEQKSDKNVDGELRRSSSIPNDKSTRKTNSLVKQSSSVNSSAANDNLSLLNIAASNELVPAPHKAQHSVQALARDPYARPNIPTDEVLNEVIRRLKYYKTMKKRLAQGKRYYESVLLGSSSSKSPSKQDSSGGDSSGSGSSDSTKRKPRRRRSRSDRRRKATRSGSRDRKGSLSGGDASVMDVFTITPKDRAAAIWEDLFVLQLTTRGKDNLIQPATGMRNSGRIEKLMPPPFLPRRMFYSNFSERAKVSFLDLALERNANKPASSAAIELSATQPQLSKEKLIEEGLPFGKITSPTPGFIYLLRDITRKYPKLTYCCSRKCLPEKPNGPCKCHCHLPSTVLTKNSTNTLLNPVAERSVVVKISSIHFGPTSEVIHRIRTSDALLAEKFLFFILDEWRFRPNYLYLRERIVRWICSVQRLTSSVILQYWKIFIQLKNEMVASGQQQQQKQQQKKQRSLSPIG